MSTRPGWMVIAFRIVIALLGFGAVVTEIATLVERGRFNGGNFFSFFTIESNSLSVLILLVSALALAAGRDDRPIAMLRGANTVNMVVVGVAFSLLLAGLENTEFTAVPWDNTVLHYIAPIAVALDWLVDVPRVAIGFRQAMVWLLFPTAYVGYSLVRGPIVDWYPYPFLDPDHHGYAGVAVTSLLLLVMGAALASGLAWTTRRAAAKHPTPAGSSARRSPASSR
ncbi:hypothetical protein ACVW00_000743 [Marmoricola sp. URHA0025 HA25]